MLTTLIHFKNKYFLLHNNHTNSLFNKIFNKSTFNKGNNLNIVKNKEESIKDSKNFIYFKNNENNTSDILSSKSIKKNHNSIYEINSTKKIDENNYCKLNKKSIFYLNSKKNIQWQKAISQQVLLSISNKANKAEIHLKPEYLGSIYIKIKMRNIQAELQFISNHVEIKNFLHSCVPFLRDALTKKGIFLKKVNIYSSIFPKKNKYVFFSKDNLKTSNKIQNFYKYLIQKKVVNIYV